MNVNEIRVEQVEKYLLDIDLSNNIKHYFKNRTILVTGGAGAIGSNLVIALSNLVGENGKIIVLDNLSAIKGDNPITLPPLSNMLFVKGDIRNDIDLKRVFREEPAIVYHLAAFFANQNSVDYPENSADVDINGIIKLLDFCQFTKVEKFIYASSGCAIYGSYGKMPLKEDFISMHLTTPYQINKMAGEMYSNFYHHHYGLNTVNCRFFNFPAVKSQSFTQPSSPAETTHLPCGENRTAFIPAVWPLYVWMQRPRRTSQIFILQSCEPLAKKSP